MNTKPIPIFPLPDHVLLPHVPTPFRLFEPRYVAMAQALEAQDPDQRWLVIPKLVDGWQGDYHGNPAFHEVAVVARVLDLRAALGNDFLMIVEGQERCRIQEVVSDTPFRQGLLDAWPDDDEAAALDLSPLLGLAHLLVDQNSKGAGLLSALTDDEPDSRELLSRLGATFLRDPNLRQHFLELSGPGPRADLVRQALLGLLGAAPKSAGHPSLN